MFACSHLLNFKFRSYSIEDGLQANEIVNCGVQDTGDVQDGPCFYLLSSCKVSSPLK